MSSGTPHDFTIDTFEILRAINLPSTEKQREGITKIPKIKQAEGRVLTNLALRRNNTSFQCNPSLKRIADDLFTTRGTISNIIKSLKEKNLIRVTKRWKYNSEEQMPSQYWIMIDIDKIHDAFNDEEASDYILNHHEEFYVLYDHEFR